MYANLALSFNQLRVHLADQESPIIIWHGDYSKSGQVNLGIITEILLSSMAWRCFFFILFWKFSKLTLRNVKNVNFIYILFEICVEVAQNKFDNNNRGWLGRGFMILNIVLNVIQFCKRTRFRSPLHIFNYFQDILTQ